MAEKAIKEWGRRHLTEQDMENFYAGKVKFPESLALLAHLRSCRKCDENFFAMLVEKDLVKDGLLPPKRFKPLPPKIKKALEEYRKKNKK
ncbi:MAG: hypothetical protein QXR60_02745 [Candidatus Nanoarchaeia archaeon]